MGYPFPIIEHKVYGKTFLKDVRVALEFEPVSQASLSKEVLNAFFKHFPGLENADVAENLADGITIYSEDRSVGFRFSLANVEVKLKTPFYVSFDQAEAFWKRLSEYLSTLSVEAVNRLVVRKSSELCFKKGAGNFDVKKLMKEVFCDELTADTAFRNASFKDLNRWERSWSAEDTENGSRFTAIYGFKLSDYNNQDDRLTLVTSIESTDSEIPISTLISKEKQYNKVLFDAFHWCVKDEIIEKMK